MDKRIVRKRIIRRLQKGSSHNYSNLYHQLFALKPWSRAKVVATTMSTSIEISTWPIIRQAWRQHKRVVVPKTKAYNQMSFYQYSFDTRLKRDRFGIWEPVDNHKINRDQIDLIVVPGLAFTKSGERLGYGGGYYDRYLRSYGGFTVGLARSWQIVNHPDWPVSRWDVKVDKIISE